MVRQSLRAALVAVFTFSVVVLGFSILSAINIAIGPRVDDLWLMISGFHVVSFFVSAVGLWFVVFGGERSVSVAALLHALSLFVLAGVVGGQGMVLPIMIGLFEVIASYLLIEHARMEQDVLG